jgi:DNA-binding beta-propeller fold protein YncE
MYVVGSIGDNVYQYSLSSAWNIASASYDSVFFYVGSEELTPHGITFRDGGAKMFVVGFSGDDVNEYTLSESWNVASAAFSGVAFNPFVSPDLTTPSALEFSADGLSLYLLDSTREAIYQFSLLEANNISSATYLPRAPTISIATLEVSPTDIALRPDGTRLYFIGSGRDNVYQYSLSVPFNLQSATYSNVNLYVNAQETAPQALAFKPDGSKMYLIGTTADSVFQYTLSSPWDLDSASYDSISFSVTSRQTQPLGLAFSEDGTQMYVLGSTPANVHQYVLSSAWDVSSASYSGKTFSVSSEEVSPQALAFKPDGKLMYIAGTNDIVYQYSLSTAWDVSTASNSSLRAFYAEALVDSIVGLTFSPKGDKLYLIGSGADIIQEIPIL